MLEIQGALGIGDDVGFKWGQEKVWLMKKRFILNILYGLGVFLVSSGVFRLSVPKTSIYFEISIVCGSSLLQNIWYFTKRLEIMSFLHFAPVLCRFDWNLSR